MRKSKRKLDHSLVDTQVFSGRIGKKKLYLALFIVMFVQGIVLCFLFFPEDIKYLLAKRWEPNWRDWEQKGEHAFNLGKMYQAIYFLEKSLREMPKRDPAQERVRKKLSHIYDIISRNPDLQKISLMPEDLALKQLPLLCSQAENEYSKGNYSLAKKLYYEFLTKIDESQKNQSLFKKVYFRIHQCNLLVSLKDKKSHGDPLLKQTLEIVKD